MGSSPRGYLQYGVALPKDGLPWDERGEEFDEWYYETVRGYEHPFKAFDEKGVRPGITDEQISEYFRHYREFKERNPLPFELRYGGSWEFPTYLLTIGKRYEAEWDEVRQIYPEDLLGIRPADKYALMDFLEKHSIEYEDGPGWFLTTFYG